MRFYPGVDGLKTGYTKEALYCLTATAKKNNIRFITVTMGVDTSEHRSVDTTSMLNYGFTNYKLNTILKKEDVLGEIEIKKGRQSKGTYSVLEDVTDLIKQNENKTYTYNKELNSIKAPIKKGDVVGSLEIIDNNGKVVKTVDLVINENIKKHSIGSMFWDIYKKVVHGDI